MQWKDPERFNPERYNSAPTSHDIDGEKCDQMGFAKCPFEQTSFEVKDGRKASITIADSARPMASSTASRFRFVTMRASHRSASAIVVALASNSLFRS